MPERERSDSSLSAAGLRARAAKAKTRRKKPRPVLLGNAELVLQEARDLFQRHPAATRHLGWAAGDYRSADVLGISASNKPGRLEEEPPGKLARFTAQLDFLRSVGAGGANKTGSRQGRAAFTVAASSFMSAATRAVTRGFAALTPPSLRAFAAAVTSGKERQALLKGGPNRW